MPTPPYPEPRAPDLTTPEGILRAVLNLIGQITVPARLVEDKRQIEHAAQKLLGEKA